MDDKRRAKSVGDDMDREGHNRGKGKEHRHRSIQEEVSDVLEEVDSEDYKVSNIEEQSFNEDGTTSPNAQKEGVTRSIPRRRKFTLNFEEAEATEQNVQKMSNILGFSPPKKKSNSITHMKNMSKSLEEIPMTIEELLASERKTSPSKSSSSSVSPKRERAATDHILKRAVAEDIKTHSSSVIREGKKNNKDEDKPELYRTLSAGDMVNKKKKKPVLMTSSEAKKKGICTLREYDFERVSWAQVESFVGEQSRYPIGTPVNGFHLELGRPIPTLKPTLEAVEAYQFYYRDHIYATKHINYIGTTKSQQYVIISISQVEEEDPRTGNTIFRALIRTTEADKRVDILKVKGHKAKDVVKALKGTFSYLYSSKLSFVNAHELTNELLNFELTMTVTSLKFGVLLCKDGQTTEAEMYANVETTPEFEEFLGLLGDKIQLQGFKGFAGGLDTSKDNYSGIHSVFTRHEGLDIMFHVSTLLPFRETDPQQLERKRHIGNDVVVLIFNNSDKPWSPSTMVSHFNHVYIVVQPSGKSPEGKTIYRLGVACKVGVPPFGPLIKSPGIYEYGSEFRTFLLTKMINAERAAYECPAFLNQIRKTRKLCLEEIGQKWIK